MKILVAIELAGKPFKKNTVALKWVARAGYSIRIFVEASAKARMIELVDDYNYQEYLDMAHTIVVDNTTPESYAAKNGYSLLLTIPSTLKAWNNNRDQDKDFVDYTRDVGNARVSMAGKPVGETISFGNGAVMTKVKV